MTEMNYNPEEYKAKKRAELDKAYEMLKEETEAIVFDKGELMKYLDTQAKFNMYSVSNAILIAKQNPDAMQLKTFNDWKAKNVMINKGAKGISIIEPTEFEKSDGSKGTGYNVKKLFDVSQTNGIQREGYFKNLNDRQLLKALVSKSPIPIEAVDVIDGQRNAMFDIRNQKIFVKRGLEPTDFFRDVSIEMAHVEFAADNYGYNRSDHEYKARIAAYMLCRRYGIDVKDFAVALPDSYQEMKHKDIRAEFNTVRKAMNEINSRMNDAIEKQRKEKSEQER